MRKYKKIETVTIDDGNSLASLIAEVQRKGITEKDFDKVKVKMDYVGCCGHPDGEYCYCPSSYTDIRFEWSL